MSKYTIGAVGFGKWYEADSCPHKRCFQRQRRHWERLDLMGDERIAMLQLALDRCPLPEGVLLIGYIGGSGVTPIAPDDVRWDTSGLRPGGA